MNLELNDKTALISGSTKGIGFAIASELAAEGARVIVNGRSDQAVASAVERIRRELPDAKVEGFAGDLATAETVKALFLRFPMVDILVNNLGIFEPKPFEEIPDEDWRRFFDINVVSGARLSRTYLSGMKQRKWGRIVFISSESAIQIPVEMIHYGTTKTALLGLSRGIAESCAGTGVTVNAVLPGPTRSAGVEEFVSQRGSCLLLIMCPEQVEQAVAHFASQVPLGRRGKPEEMGAGDELTTTEAVISGPLDAALFFSFSISAQEGVASLSRRTGRVSGKATHTRQSLIAVEKLQCPTIRSERNGVRRPRRPSRKKQNASLVEAAMSQS